MQHKEAENSTLETYIGIDKREGLVSIGKRLHKSKSLSIVPRVF